MKGHFHLTNPKVEASCFNWQNFISFKFKEEKTIESIDQSITGLLFPFVEPPSLHRSIKETHSISSGPLHISKVVDLLRVSPLIHDRSIEQPRPISSRRLHFRIPATGIRLALEPAGNRLRKSGALQRVQIETANIKPVSSSGLQILSAEFLLLLGQSSAANGRYLPSINVLPPIMDSMTRSVDQRYFGPSKNSTSKNSQPVCRVSFSFFPLLRKGYRVRISFFIELIIHQSTRAFKTNPTGSKESVGTGDFGNLLKRINAVQRSKKK